MTETGRKVRNIGFPDDLYKHYIQLAEQNQRSFTKQVLIALEYARQNSKSIPFMGKIK